MKLEEAKGDWALVTGATSGIGREFASQLAAAGMNLVLVARRRSMLETVGDELTLKYGIQVLVVQSDLSESGETFKVKTQVAESGVAIRMLVNNAASACWGHFESATPELYEKLVHLNNSAMVSLCSLFLHDLASFPTSAIINVSSPAGYNPVPYMAVYAATKAFVSSFSQALYEELKYRGIFVQTLVPGPTDTELGIAAAAYAPALRDMKPAETVVKTSLAHLEKSKPMVTTAGGAYKQRLFAALLPTRIVLKVVGDMFHPPERQ